MNPLTASSLSTPDGVFTILADGSHVLASGWTSDVETLRALIHPDLRGPLREISPPLCDLAKDAVDAVEAYYEGDHRAPGDLPVRQRSGPFRELAWKLLRQVEPGAAVTYTDYATLVGRPDAVRAAAGACAANAAALFVPCHRILRSDGGLGGFRYGTELKRGLLARESEGARSGV